jgi:S-adenosylmethionine:tRNA ribosyltransferase-isomerase
VKTSDFDYELPPERIAQTPVEPRHAARLLVIDRVRDTIEHRIFSELGQMLEAGDLLVINQTRVIPARIYARKQTGGRIEILLLNQRDERTWEALVGGKRVMRGRQVQLEDGPGAEIIEALDGARRLVRFEEPLDAYLERKGQMPLPPYIHTPLANPERYQTVYAAQPGSAAAPTAGLHFTPELMQSLQEQGLRFAAVTLHVGLDTFAPVNEDNPTEHLIHSEWCELPPETAEAIRQTRAAGRRVVAVGTTSVRTLETAARQAGEGQLVVPFSGPTVLYILPGFEFKLVDAMITNFHLPRSTLLMLVSAFAGRERILNAYHTALDAQYRFYSFGDATLIL